MSDFLGDLEGSVYRREVIESKELEIMRFSVPTLDLADTAQEIGFQAWRDRLSRVGEQAIKMVFDPKNPERATQLLKKMQEKDGKFAAVIAKLGGEAVGYAWAADDISGGKLARFAKRRMSRKPYAWVAQINVLPDYQRGGIGTIMLEEALDRFDSDQAPTAYVFDENKQALRWFDRIGFNKNPFDPSNPVLKTNYFGEEYPVEQWRLQADSVDSVFNYITLRYPRPLHYFVTDVN